MPEFSHFSIERLNIDQRRVGRKMFDQVCTELGVPLEDRAFRSLLAELIVQSIAQGTPKDTILASAIRLADARYPPRTEA